LLSTQNKQNLESGLAAQPKISIYFLLAVRGPRYVRQLQYHSNYIFSPNKSQLPGANMLNVFYNNRAFGGCGAESAPHCAKAYIILTKSLTWYISYDKILKHFCLGVLIFWEGLGHESEAYLCLHRVQAEKL